MLNILKDIIFTILGYLKADWYILLIGIILAVSMSVYVDPKKLKSFFERKAGISIPGAVVFGALTPLCACGSMAVILSMFVSTMPWGTVMAFLISSPLTSPSEYMFETAFFGSKFATGLLISSVILGIIAGITAHILQKKTNFFKGQFRLVKETSGNCDSCGTDEVAAGCGCEDTESCDVKSNKEGCGCGEAKVDFCHSSIIKKYKLDKVLKEFWNIGIKKILLYFIMFIAVGRIVELIIPKEWIMTLFSSDKAYSIPLAATVGLPLYLTNASAIPLLKSFINAGAGEGAVMAFLIAGKATGIPVIAGMSTFLKKRALLFYVGFIYLGAILSGYLFQLIASFLI